MNLAEITKGLDVEITGDARTEISDIFSDSRAVTPGSLFAAVRGSREDGNRFVRDAVKKGAAAVFTDENIDDPGVPVIKSSSFQKELALLCDNFYSRPADSMRMIAITGTNGKTTTSYILRGILSKSEKTGLIGTICHYIGDNRIDAQNTTPDSLTLRKLLNSMRQEGVKSVIMEVSSHGLKLDRVYGLSFDAAVFTNLTQDHLDFHNTMEDYLNSKLMLFSMLRDKGAAVINGDDRYAEKFIEASSPHRQAVFGIRESRAEWKINIRKISMKGSSFTLCSSGGESFELDTPLVGDHNIYNTAAAFLTAYMLGTDAKEAALYCSDPPPVRGRFEKIADKRGFNVIIDYAHTPDALERVIKTAKRLTEGRVITLFGCGGDRDKSKRPIMGKIATHLSDIAIITSDNPRTENPNSIIDEILTGVSENNYTVEINRAHAIKYAIDIAQKGDTVIIAGKGHEDYQIIGTKKFHFDDRENALIHMKEAK